MKEDIIFTVQKTLLPYSKTKYINSIVQERGQYFHGPKANTFLPLFKREVIAPTIQKTGHYLHCPWERTLLLLSTRKGITSALLLWGLQLFKREDITSIVQGSGHYFRYPRKNITYIVEEKQHYLHCSKGRTLLPLFKREGITFFPSERILFPREITLLLLSKSEDITSTVHERGHYFHSPREDITSTAQENLILSQKTFFPLTKRHYITMSQAMTEDQGHLFVF